MKNIFLLLFYNFAIISLFSQELEENLPIQYNYTEDVVFTEDFTGAIRLYKEMISFDPKNPVFYYKLGFAYLNTFDKQDSAIFFLNKSIKLYKKNYRNEMSPLEAKFYLARAYRLTNQIDSALFTLYEIKKIVNDSVFLFSIEKEIKSIQATCKLNQYIKDLPQEINSSYTEHSPILIGNYNILLFTSRRKNNISIELPDGQWAENIYMSKKIDTSWTDAEIVTELSSFSNDATCFATYDQKHLLVYKDDEAGSIFITTYEDNRWATPVKLPRPINSIYRESHASMTKNMDTIFFTSNRPGGYGGMDIWMSVKDSLGKWKKPENLGPNLNTKKDEESPNISIDGKTLYFSSNGRVGFGGFDIYKTKLNEFGKWTLAQNMGYPINSSKDDLFYVDYKNQNIALFASYRTDSTKRSDVFVFNLDTANIDKNIVNYGFLLDSTENPIKDALIQIKNIKTNKINFAKPTNLGKFIFVTEPFSEYEISIVLNNKKIFDDNIYVNDYKQKIVFYKKIILSVYR